MQGDDGIDPDLADWVNQVREIVEADYPGISIVIASGYRSPFEQAALRARWDSGNRVGLVVRPALDSAHSHGLAVDLQFTVAGLRVPVRATPTSAFRWVADLLGPLGVIWGGRFKVHDPNHFEIVAKT